MACNKHQLNVSCYYKDVRNKRLSEPYQYETKKVFQNGIFLAHQLLPRVGSKNRH